MELLECIQQWGAVFSKEKRADLQAWEVIKKDKEIGHPLWARQGFLKDIMEMSKNPFNFYNATPFNFKIQGQGTVFFIMIKDLECSFRGILLHLFGRKGMWEGIKPASGNNRNMFCPLSNPGLSGKKKKAFLMGTFIPNLPEGFLFLKFLFFKVLFDPRIIEKNLFFKNESVRSIENLMSMDQTVESFWLKFVLTHHLVNYSSLNVLREIQSL